MKHNKIILHMIVFISIIFISSKGFCSELQDLNYNKIKPVKISLADENTIKLLSTDWLKEKEKESFTSQKPGISYVFWIFLVIIILLAVFIFILFSSRMTRDLSLRIKLYISYFSLVILAFLLGSAGFIYLNNVNRFAHQERFFWELDMTASEIQGFQNEFLLHGIENQEYGEKMIHNLEKKLEIFEEYIRNIKINNYLQENQIHISEELKENLFVYKNNIREMVTAFQEMKKSKKSS